MTSKRFELNTEPHIAEIGESAFKFKPEIFADELLDSWAELRESMKIMTTLEGEETDDTAATKLRVTQAREAVKKLVASLLIEESVAEFTETRLPDRVMMELMRWLLEVYGLRPTGPSSGSSTPSPTETTPGDSSTADSSAKESTS